MFTIIASRLVNNISWNCIAIINITHKSGHSCRIIQTKSLISDSSPSSAEFWESKRSIELKGHHYQVVTNI